MRVLQGVRFVGTTLWSDFDALLERPERSPAIAARNDKAREKAFRAANHYLRTTGGTRHGEPMLAEAIRAQAQVCQAWLREALAQPYTEGPTVVVTHFAPSLRSGDPRYGLTPGTAGFCNALDELLPLADLWLHGHLHCPSDYVDTSGPRHCRVVANPLGYAGNGEQEGFRPHCTVSVCLSLLIWIKARGTEGLMLGAHQQGALQYENPSRHRRQPLHQEDAGLPGRA